MKFSIAALSFQRGPGDDRPIGQLYSDLFRFVDVAEEAGFDNVWLTEHHFADDGWLPSVVPVAAALLARTKKLRIGTGIAIAPFYDPIRLAEDAAVLDIISGGRFDLGLAIGYRSEEFRAFGIPRSQRVKRLEEVVEVVRRSWSDDALSFSGNFYKYTSVNVTPKPATSVPIHIGGIVETATKRAATIGDGFLSSGTVPLDVLGERVQYLREATVGRPFEMGISKYGFVWHDSDEAWNIYRPGYMYDQQQYADWYADDQVEGLYRERRKQADEVMRESALCGDPDEVIRAIEGMRSALGDFNLAIRLWVPGIDQKKAEEAVRLFGREVIPHFTSA